MIVDLLLEVFELLLTVVLSPFPTTGPPVAFEHLGTVVGHLGDLNYFLPIAETFAVVIGVMVLFPVFLGITLSLWVVAQLRGSSSVG